MPHAHRIALSLCIAGMFAGGAIAQEPAQPKSAPGAGNVVLELDKEMTLSGLSISFDTDPGSPPTLVIRSTDIGHAFPTYVTPRVICRVGYTDEKGRFLEGAYLEAIISRDVDLGPNPIEWADTRLLPGETRRYKLLLE